MWVKTARWWIHGGSSLVFWLQIQQHMQTAQLQKTKGLSTLRHPLPPPFPTFQRLHTFLETLPHTTLELEVSPGEYISVLTWALYLCVSVCTACLSVGKVFFYFFNQKKQLLLKRVCLKVPFYSTGWSAADLILLSRFSWKFGSPATYRAPPPQKKTIFL